MTRRSGYACGAVRPRVDAGDRGQRARKAARADRADRRLPAAAGARPRGRGVRQAVFGEVFPAAEAVERVARVVPGRGGHGRRAAGADLLADDDLRLQEAERHPRALRGPGRLPASARPASGARRGAHPGGARRGRRLRARVDRGARRNALCRSTRRCGGRSTSGSPRRSRARGPRRLPARFHRQPLAARGVRHGRLRLLPAPRARPPRSPRRSCTPRTSGSRWPTSSSGSAGCAMPPARCSADPQPFAAMAEEKIRLGGMALPERRARARPVRVGVRDPARGRAHRGRPARKRFRAARIKSPFLRGPARLAEALACSRRSRRSCRGGAADRAAARCCGAMIGAPPPSAVVREVEARAGQRGSSSSGVVSVAPAALALRRPSWRRTTGRSTSRSAGYEHGGARRGSTSGAAAISSGRSSSRPQWATRWLRLAPKGIGGARRRRSPRSARSPRRPSSSAG